MDPTRGLFAERSPSQIFDSSFWRLLKKSFVNSVLSRPTMVRSTGCVASPRATARSRIQCERILSRLLVWQQRNSNNNNDNNTARTDRSVPNFVYLNF